MTTRTPLAHLRWVEQNWGPALLRFFFFCSTCSPAAAAVRAAGAEEDFAQINAHAADARRS